MFPVLHHTRCIAWLLCGVLSVPAVFADQTTPNQGLHENTPTLFALVNATVVTEPGKRIPNATLILEDGRIQRVIEDGDVPPGATIIDLKGHFIYPGFIDLYTQYGVEPYSGNGHHDEEPIYDAHRKGGNASNDAIHSQISWIDRFEPNPDNAQSWIQDGFTAVQSARFDGILQGRGMLISLADGLPNDLVYRAQAQYFGSFDKGTSEQAYPTSLMGSISLIRQTLTDAQWYTAAHKQQGATNLAIEYNAALAGLSEIAERGIVFKTTDDLMLLRAAGLFNEFDVPLTALGSHYEYGRLREIKASGVNIVLPLNFPDAPTVDSLDDAADVTLAKLRHWERAPGNPAALANAKIPFALTREGSNGSFWQNLKQAMAHGLKADDALAALTLVPAQLAGVSDQLGRIAPGYRADLVITSGDLFAGGEIRQVWLQGQQQLLDPTTPQLLAGQYRLEIDGKPLTLSFEYSDGNLHGELLHEQTTLAISSLNLFSDRLRFSAELEQIGFPGVSRFALERHKEKLLGQMIDGSGKPHALLAIASGGKQKTAVKPTVNEANYIGQLTYPNRAFGLTQVPSVEKVHIKNATIWTSTDKGNLQNSDLLFANGEIEEIGQDLDTPSGYLVIDAQGKHLTAGIIDAHSHLAISHGVNEASDAVTSEVRIGDVLDPEDPNIYRALAGGVTSAHLLHGSANPIGGQAQVIQLRWGATAEALKFKGAPASIKFALGENVKQSGWGDRFDIRYPQTRLGVEAIIRDYFQTAKEYEAKHKAYNDLGRRAKRDTLPPRTDYRMEALVEILNSERFIHPHSYVASEMLALLQVADDFGFTVQTFTHALEGYKVADSLAKHGATASTFADWWAYKFEVYDAIPQNACLMQQRGVNVSINSDSEDLIRRLNQEAAKSMMYCDMKPEQAWQLVTLNPAIQLKIDDQVGSLEEGKQADIVLWNHNPMSSYARAEVTWVAGQRYFDRQRDKVMRQQQAKEKQLLIQKILAGDNGHAEDDSDTAGASYKIDQPSWHCDTQHDIWKQTHQHHVGGH
ncbi:amidohydrolase [Corallincola luteus]|uniref:Amidohydrolase n=1 Tax=Corallincola luteus TaxID=1775177 RepID=A0ABY2ANU1_9GAMM|nr:amidohydrolase family protein [Corallincola luteus]TCI04863.1 amidohydrolase [Corallincola luteus]